ncbi:AGAP005483-PA-like protein [Anopheles sinensis]|uniref:AGAP005483-PA-like protein n=1 Tax=Anopheles sinensis TaxID=74873 RepID=A0A084W2X0_ANOSI|nr:AGAP005483-PA-like protein [Anopheles sinensis]
MAIKCRLCLSKIETNASTTSIDDICFRDKLQAITSDDSFPSLVCSECEGKVDQFHVYQEEVKQNQDRLWSSKLQECIGETTIEHAPNSEHEELMVSIPKTEKIEAADNNSLQTPEDSDASIGDIDDPENEPLSTSEEIKTDYNKSKKTYAPLRKQTKVRKNVRLRDVENKKEPRDGVGRKKFNHLDEKNRRLQEFYDMKCEICGEQQVSFTTLKIHYHQQHNVRGYIKCCGRMFNSRYRLLEHLSCHVGASMVRCEICEKTFSSRSYLLVHNSRVHGRAEDRPFKCTQCHQSYAHECHLKAHMVYHVRVRCSICGKELSSSLSLQSHMKRMHGDVEKHICETCGKEFRSRPAFNQHVKLHMGTVVVEQAQCTICSKWLNSKRALKQHIKHVHDEAGKPFKCDQCGQEFIHSRSLSDHKMRVHVEERYECEVCGKRFKRSIYLKEHSAIHSGQPLYSCDICDATFNSKSNKYSHRKKKHPVEWEARRREQLTANTKILIPPD